jgi:hypothetical protein
MSTDPINAVTNGLARVCGHQVDKPKFLAYVRALLEEVDLVDVAFKQVATIDDIDASVGVQLDVLGAIVGQPRRLTAALINAFFGFEPVGGGDYVLAMPYGDDDIPGFGGQFFSEGDSTTASADMVDVDYRKAIKARIAYNNTRVPSDGVTAYSDGLFHVLRYIFSDAGATGLPGYPLYVHDDGDMHITIGIGKVPNQQEKALLLYAHVLPVPSGVGFSTVIWDADASSTYYLGFDDTYAGTWIAGMGDTDFPAMNAGRFAEELS